ncbi:MAG: IS1595 family transposase [Maricaulaceae bacterium]|jgi:transposase-like protein
MSSILSAKHFHDEKAAYRWVEARLWPNGPECPRCGQHDRISKMKGKSTRIGTYKCYQCRKPFTVKVGTIFESSHVKMHIWLQAIHLMAASKKGFSTNQFARVLGVSLQTAWFMSHRIREAMKDKGGVFGGGGGPVESDETYFGLNPDVPRSRTPIRSMNAVLTLVDRESGAARSMVMKDLNSSTIAAVFAENVAKEARIYTDEAPHYKRPAKEHAAHETVSHARGEFYKAGDPTIHTQCVEGYYSVFKRGMRGTYQHCSRKHLHRYCIEFDFRYSHRAALGVDDAQRADALLQGAKGRRLTYQTTRSGHAAAQA